ncbi:hypothetical protein F4821DRAFT_264586 [Hypoxylon rubiginosum]|uniref:Uncharacterized protein n=1 Tax=Hypoxylon rubiginosum TaxID=110542 RepID=A0ACC0CN07_9PEZI|nr:hypothetical protein F4821DRAFT_264586 [Hypoxylon rubiginosum]
MRSRRKYSNLNEATETKSDEASDSASSLGDSIVSGSEWDSAYDPDPDEQGGTAMEEDTYGPPGGPVQVAIAISGLQQHIALLRNSMEMLYFDPELPLYTSILRRMNIPPSMIRLILPPLDFRPFKTLSMYLNYQPRLLSTLFRKAMWYSSAVTLKTFHRCHVTQAIAAAIWMGAGAHTVPLAPLANSSLFLRASEPVTLWATFWDATEHFIDMEFDADGLWKGICDLRAFHTVSVQQQPLGYECEWLTVDGAVWKLATGDWKRFGPPSQLSKGRCVNASDV